MSRSGYDDYSDGDDMSYGLWRGAVLAASRGGRGQAMLKELRDALDAMPEKKLIADSLVDSPTGEVCALGALGLKRGLNMERIDPEESDVVARKFGIAEPLAREIVFMNDERYGKSTPEVRWAQMRAWVNDQILPDKPVLPEREYLMSVDGYDIHRVKAATRSKAMWKDYVALRETGTRMTFKDFLNRAKCRLVLTP